MKTLEEAELCFPQLLNSSCWTTARPHSASMLTYIILLSITLLTVNLNLLVIISISHFRKLHSPTNLLLLSLAVSDFFVGLLMFFQIVLIDGCWFLGDLMCILYYILDYIITSASIGTMVLISIDRYVAICDPLHYPTKVTQKRVKICVCVCWVCSTISHSLLLKDNLEQPGRYNSCSGECVVVIDYVAGIVDLFLSFIGPVTVIIALYMRVFVAAMSQARAMRSQIAAVTLRCSVKITARKSELKAARTLGVVIIVFLICVCPYFCVALTGQDTFLNASSAAFVICLFYFNSCLNPVIYAFFYPWFRKSVKLIVTLQILKPGSCEANIA
ncbi:trace amine-associated receptor 13c-like [Lates calcarifer]|uniref:Trace amine-associated receptor 13c-like n=1 Tax=Lates calcarifer TaxID=8187 RepID=A0AAJ7L7Y0_LATCA|nr:trace amine-associated receptor 13c-like [Lates calcarifer]XP_018527023.1 trace amine-associated receptor 13c-like [Lates calcarifer]